MTPGWTSRVAIAALAQGKPQTGVRVDWPIQLAAFAMGTRFELIIADADASMGTTDALAAGEAAMDIVREWHRRLTIFEPGSAVSRINAEAPHRAITVDREVFELLLVCRELHRQTSGAFDPSIGALMHKHGLRAQSHPDTPCDPTRSIAWGFDGIELDKARMTVRFIRPGIALDFGAIAKGLALDQAAALLREFGITAALIHGGTSSVITIGTPPGLDGWRVQLGSSHDAPVVVLRDHALAVSAPRTRPGNDAEQTEHVIDPRNGQTTGMNRLAACLSKSAILADAWSTALLVTARRTESMPDHLCSILADPTDAWLVTGNGWTLRDNIIAPDSTAPTTSSISTRKTHPA